jgi:hypothetical protein
VFVHKKLLSLTAGALFVDADVFGCNVGAKNICMKVFFFLYLFCVIVVACWEKSVKILARNMNVI